MLHDIVNSATSHGFDYFKYFKGIQILESSAHFNKSDQPIVVFLHFFHPRRVTTYMSDLGMATDCINMYGHTFMGRPAARLETMALLISLYVLVCIVGKRRWLFPYGCNLLIYVMILPCYLQKPLTRNQKLFNVWIHVRRYHSRNPTKVSCLVQ